MAKDPALLFYTSDFLTGTMLMTHEQVGIYIRLICLLHQSGGEIDQEAFDAYVGLENKLLRAKFEFKDGKVSQKRLLNEMIKRSKKSSNLSDNAKKSWQNRCKTDAKASGLHKPIEDVNVDENVNEIKDLKGCFNNTEAFEIAWSQYPVKDGKKAAERSFNASVHNQADMDILMSAMDNYLKSEKVLKGFIKNGSTWFANWKDWVAYVPPLPQEGKPPAEIVAVTCVAQGMKDDEIKRHMIDKGYTEQRIDEAIMKARGKLK